MRSRCCPVWLAAATALVVTFAPSLWRGARADAVPGAPEDCPPGSHGTTSHDGNWCTPSACDAASDCASGYACREIALCVLEETYTPASRLPPLGGAGATATRAIARSECAADGSCASGACVRAKRCVDERPATEPRLFVEPPETPPPVADARADAAGVLPPPAPGPGARAGSLRRVGCGCVLAGAERDEGGLAVAAALGLTLAARRRRAGRRQVSRA